MGTWNYRVVRKTYQDGHEELGIYSVYYDGDENVQGMSVDPAPVNSYSIEQLAELLELMKQSLQKPILEYPDEVLKNDESSLENNPKLKTAKIHKK